jgi:hypothetical protein
VDIANALADVLGVKAKFNNAPFDGLLLALDGKRYDVIMSAMTASDERKQAVDFIRYFNSRLGSSSRRQLQVDQDGRRPVWQEGGRAGRHRAGRLPRRHGGQPGQARQDVQGRRQAASPC